MKQPILFFSALVMLISSCTNSPFEGPAEGSVVINHSIPSTHISCKEAIEIASNVTNQGNRTRSNSYEISYIMRSHQTRGENEIGDTLAYVINFEKDNGFAIIASDSRVYPILAFSENGTFDTNNPIANENFLGRIEPYMDNACTQTRSISYPGDYTYKIPPVRVAPMLTTTLNQWSPYNKYVAQRKPGFPAGCIPLATASIISHVKETLTYNGHTYNFKAINNGIGGDGSLMSYSEATDKMARFICDLGIAMKVEFDEENIQTLCGIAEPLREFWNTSCNIMTQTTDNHPIMFKYNDQKVVEFLHDSCYIYITGYNPDYPKYEQGHGWVIDGCAYYLNMDMALGKNVKTCIYLHCDWGWGGQGNGYFTGEIFNPLDGYKYTDFDYAAIK